MSMNPQARRAGLSAIDAKRQTLRWRFDATVWIAGLVMAAALVADAVAGDRQVLPGTCDAWKSASGGQQRAHGSLAATTEGGLGTD